jgi:pimeloyl-ACP methyl ester carboxylesterase
MNQQEFLINTSVGELYSVLIEKNKKSPTIVFLHDSLGCTALWRDFPNKLIDITSCNALIYDRQGYGKSCEFSEPSRKQDYMHKEAEILKEVLNFFEIENAILLGHSDGATIALMHAAMYPKQTKALISIGAHIFVEDITRSGISKVVAKYKTSNLHEKLAKFHFEKTDAMIKAWSDTWLSSEFRTWNIENELIKIKCPVLAIQGENDEFGSIAQLNGIKEKVEGNCEIQLIDNAKHSPHAEFPDKIITLISDFIFEND